MNMDDVIYLKHILESIGDIQKSTKKISKKTFIKDKNILDATLRRIEVIGEAVKNISDKIKNKYPGVEWKKIAGTRDVLIHAYFSVDTDLVWDIVKKDIPLLKKNIDKILKEFSAGISKKSGSTSRHNKTM